MTERPITLGLLHQPWWSNKYVLGMRYKWLMETDVHFLVDFVDSGSDG